MRKLSLVLAIVLVLVTAASVVAVDINLKEQNSSGQTGIVSLTEAGGKVKVVIAAKPAFGNATQAQPAHIHEGSCPTPGKVIYPLTSVVNGQSTTEVTTTLAMLTAAKHAVNLHKSPTEASVYTSCADIVMAAAPTTALPRTGGFELPLVLGAGSILAALGFALRRR